MELKEKYLKAESGLKMDPQTLHHIGAGFCI